MDENLWDDTIWIWDTEFMVLFCKYAPNIFPGVQSLDNFYESILNRKSSSLRIHHPDNPPFYSWVEYEYFEMTNDSSRIKKILLGNRFLQRHSYWFENLERGINLHFKHAWIALEKTDLGYRWGHVQSGMDNTPRGRGCSGELLWMDAMAQQALSALYIKKIAEELNAEEISNEFQCEYDKKKETLNRYYWDEKDGFYYDLSEKDTSFVKVRTPAVFWTMLAKIPSKRIAKKMVKYADNPCEFGGKYPWPSVSRSDEEYNGEIGSYWRGSVWLPLVYMSTKALEAYGYFEIAYRNAYNLLLQMLVVYENFEPHTIWECYSPSQALPAQIQWGEQRKWVAKDFCGWSALGPISLFIENILGFYEINAIQKIVKWNKRGNKEQGIRNLIFGNITTDIIARNGFLEVTSNECYRLVVNGKTYNITEGNHRFKLH